MQKTPRIPKMDFSLVYEPAEDTFCLLDALEIDLGLLRNKKPLFCLEIGSGSGCVISFVSQLFSVLQTVPFCIATDINYFACIATQKTLLHNEIRSFCVLNTNLAYGLSKVLHGNIDLIVCNPPYVPTNKEEDSEVETHPLAKAWSGGIDGTEIIEKLLETVKTFLSEKGLFYLVMIKQNKLGLQFERFRTAGFSFKTVLKRKAGNEILFVIRLERNGK